VRLIEKALIGLDDRANAGDNKCHRMAHRESHKRDDKQPLHKFIVFHTNGAESQNFGGEIGKSAVAH
jgi:hypothetical protein